jgi:hypothetical protein
VSRHHGQLGAELTGYGETENGPRELRVDIVDRDAQTTVTSLTPAETLALMTELLSAVTRARENRLS